MEKDVADAQLAKFDDSKWQRIDLPHDWDIYHAPKADVPTGNGGGYYPAGIGWYRKTFKDTDLKTGKGETLWLHFEGVYQNSQVYVNGTLVGTHFYGYTPFKLNISPYIKKGVNTVTVRVNNSRQPNCRWYSGSGIYHDYHMVIDSCYQQDIAAMVLRDRNHPSIISYSIGNSKR